MEGCKCDSLEWSKAGMPEQVGIGAVFEKSGCGDCMGSEGDDDACTVLGTDPWQCM